MRRLTKEELRRSYLTKRREMPPEQLALWSAQMEAHAHAFIKERDFDTVMLYAAFRGEPETAGLIRRLLAEGRRVALPKCYPDSRMEAFVITEPEQLMPGAFGILEPPETCLLARQEQSLVIVPGCVFGRDGGRIGYGGGFYDRYLAGCKKAVKAGLCYSFSLLDAVPKEDFDVKMDLVVTENGVVNIL